MKNGERGYVYPFIALGKFPLHEEKSIFLHMCMSKYEKGWAWLRLSLSENSHFMKNKSKLQNGEMCVGVKKNVRHKSQNGDFQKLEMLVK